VDLDAQAAGQQAEAEQALARLDTTARAMIATGQTALQVRGRDLLARTTAARGYLTGSIPATVEDMAAADEAGRRGAKG
jgi:hypothetical protein